VQLSGIDRPGWPEFRDLQRHLLQRINYTGMAVSSDKGDSLDVHPKHKKEIGERLARWALNETYGMNITPAGPLFKSVEFQNSTAIITFEYASGLKTSDKQPLRTFEIAGIDHIYYPAQAEIIGEKVKVWSVSVPEPKSVRYGWQPFTRANLVNGDDLPASTFNTGFSPDNIEWKSLPVYPVEKGVSAPFIGVHHDVLIVGGGCNFPDIPASEGGSKQFYDQLFVLNIGPGNNAKEWKSVGKLPEPVAYGASVSTDRGIVCIGGINQISSLTKVTLIRWNEETQKPELIQWPELPVGIDNAGATQIRNCIYLLGGNQNGIPSSDMYCLDMDHLQDGWKKLSSFPGPGRLQPAVTSLDNRIFIAGGYHPSLKGEKPELFSDILTYDRISGVWTDSIVFHPEENHRKYSMVGGTAFQFNKNTIGYVGGVNYDRFFSALERESQMKRSPNDIRSAQLKKEAYDYMTQEPEWYQFNPDWMLFDPDKKTWQDLGNFPQLAGAGAGIVFHKGVLYVVCGELKPGIRTRDVNCAVISNLITNEE
jgi:sialate O-acetylesterase